MNYTLVTGANGYIGSNVCKLLLEQGKNLILLDRHHGDNINTLQAKYLEYKKDNKLVFIVWDLSIHQGIDVIFTKYRINEVLHFAADISVPESVSNPLKYYCNNTVNTTMLIDTAVKHRVKKFIFSSTAAVYGFSDTPVKEQDIKDPLNPYGRSKLMSEQVLIDAGSANPDFKYVILRYFNVAGACKDGDSYLFGHNRQAQHLIKMASEAACGTREHLTIFGENFPTPDGTGVRDYIHVVDLAQAHLNALEYLDEHDSDIFNVGYGKGYSVKEVTDTMKRVSGVDFPVVVSGPRAGDPAKVVSDNSKLLSKFGNFFKYDNLEEICRSAYQWEKNL